MPALPTFPRARQLAGAAILAVSAPAGAQAPATAPCSCLADFDRMVERLEANHAAVPLELTGARRGEYEQAKARARAQAAAASDATCVHALRALTSWFDDGHLFISEQPRLDSAETRRRAASAERVALDETALRAYLQRERASLDPIEGIWYSKGGYRVAIVAQRALGAASNAGAANGREFVGVLLTDTLPGWRAGEVKAEFRRGAAGGYHALVHASDRGRRNYEAALQKNLLLHMPPLTWGRELPLADGERGMLLPSDPRAPMLHVLDEQHVLLSIPSHSPEHRARLDSLVAAHHDAIERADVLIVDIRGNEGGSSGTTRALGPYVYTDSQRPAIGPQGAAMVLSSPDNIAYWRATTSQGWVPKGLLARLEAAPGHLVPFADDTTATPPAYRPPSIAAGPTHVAILMDRHAVSAAEAFVLMARRYTKVTLFGEPTGGTIDYQSVRLVPLACPSRGLYLGYPTIAASGSLPTGGLNRTGIVPDVRVGMGDPVGEIVRYFGGNREQGTGNREQGTTRR